MKKYLYSMFLLALPLLLMNVQNSVAQGREETKAFLMRTHMILDRAKEAVDHGHVYTGDIVKAVHHQRYAKELFKEHRFHRAIAHSYRARELARTAMRANRSHFGRDMQLLDSERALVREMPGDDELDREITIPAGENDRSIIREKEEPLHD